MTEDDFPEYAVKETKGAVTSRDKLSAEQVKSPALIVIGEVTAEPEIEKLRSLALEVIG